MHVRMLTCAYCAPVSVPVWVNSLFTYTLNGRTCECPYYCVHEHISEGMLSQGHMLINELCEMPMWSLLCVCLCVACDMIWVKADELEPDQLLDSLSLTALNYKLGLLKAEFSALGFSLRLHGNMYMHVQSLWEINVIHLFLVLTTMGAGWIVVIQNPSVEILTPIGGYLELRLWEVRSLRRKWGSGDLINAL